MKPTVDPDVRHWMTGIDVAKLDRRAPDDPSRAREAEIDDAIRDSSWRRHRSADLRRTLIESALLLTVCNALAGCRPPGLALSALAFGPALGVALHTVRTGRFLTGLFGLCAALVAQLVGAVLTTGVIAGTMPIAVASFVLPVFTIYGIRREFRGMPGWE